MNLDPLIAATNEVLGLRDPGPTDLWKVCVLGCRTLKMLGDDREFFEDLLAAAADDPQREAKIDRVTGNLQHFNDFLQIEKRLLVENGVHPSAANALIEESRRLREQIRGNRLDPRDLRIGINKLQNEVCEAEEQLQRAIDAERRKETIRALLKRVAQATGGAVIAGVNYAASSIIGPPFVEVSITVGGTLMGAAILKG
jgi:hypothetical protein